MGTAASLGQGVGSLCSFLWGGKRVSPRAVPSLECSGCRTVQPGLTPGPHTQKGPQESGWGHFLCKRPAAAASRAVVGWPQSGLALLNPPCFSCSPFPTAQPGCRSGGSVGSPHGGRPPCPGAVSMSLIVFPPWIAKQLMKKPPLLLLYPGEGAQHCLPRGCAVDPATARWGGSPRDGSKPSPRLHSGNS